MKVLLINPAIITPLATPQEKGPFSDIGENLGLGIIGANLKAANIYHKLVDCCLENIGKDKITAIIKDENFSLIGISVPSIAAYPATKELASSIKKEYPNSHIVVGGHYASIAYEFILKDSYVDTIIIDDGEYTIIELIKSLENSSSIDDINNIAFIKDEEVVRTSSKVRTTIYESPSPDRSTLSLVLEKGGYAALNTSKGCYGKCTFCSSASYIKSTNNRGWQGKSAQRVYNEIYDLVNTHNTNNFIIIDDCFLGIHQKCRSRVIKIADLIMRNSLDVRYLIMCNPEEICEDVMDYLFHSGLGAVSIGVESGDENALKRLGRNIKISAISESLEILKKIDVEVFIGLVPFDPYSKIQEIKNTVNLLYKHSVLNISNFRKRLMIMPGTQIEKQLRDEGRLLKSNKYVLLDKKTNILVEIFEEALKIYGAKLNNLLYVKKWDKAIERDPHEYFRKTRILRDVDNLINENSFNIIHEILYKASNNSLQNLEKEKNSLIHELKYQTESLFNSVFLKLNY